MMKRIWDWIDSRIVVRRAVIVFTLYMTLTETWHAWEFAKVSTFDGVGTAAVIAAVLVPLSAVQAFAFNMYMEGRK